MPTRFDHCLAQTLREETGSAQPPGGPFVRRNLRTGVVYQYPTTPLRPDGFWFDDDPHDTGGRTAAGILQREYDAWRVTRGLPTRDVWLIEDRDLQTIYHDQYWRLMRGDELPAGVDAMVFDVAVLQGVGTAIRQLQEMLGLTRDGHMGAVTMAAAQSADRVDLIRRLAERRRRYLRGCKTFWKHGAGWLARVDRVEKAAIDAATTVERLAAQAPRPGAYKMPPDPPLDDLPADNGPPLSRKAKQRPDGDGDRSAPILTGSSGSYLSIDAMAQIFGAAAAQGGLTLHNIVAAALSHPDLLAQLLAGTAVIAGTLWWWIGPRFSLSTAGA